MAGDRETTAEPTASGRAVEFGSLIFRHKVLIGFTSIVGIGLGYLYYVKTPPTFQSNCSLLIRNDSKISSVPFQTMENQGGPMQQNQLPHAILIVSPKIVKAALNKTVVIRSGEEQTETTLKELPLFRDMDNPVGHIIQHLTARPSLRNNIESQDIVNATYSDVDPVVVKAVLEAVLASYQDFLGESEKQIGAELFDFIKDAGAKLFASLKKIEDEYTEFRQENPLLFNGEIKLNGDTKSGNIHKERMKEIEMARARVSILATERKAELQSIKDALAQGGSREAIALMLRSIKPESRGSEGTIKNPAVEIFESMLQLQLLLLDLGPEHPKVKALEKRIALLDDFHNGADLENSKRKKGTDFLSVCLDALQHEINSIESKTMELDELYENERDAAKAFTVYEVKDEFYKKELERTEILYQRIAKRIEELDLLKGLGEYITAVISPPTIGKHVSPVFSKSLLLGALFGAAVGFALSYAAEASDTTFRTPEEVSEFLHLPIIGHIPVIALDTHEVRADSKLDGSLVAYFRPKSRQAESYRAIRTSLYFSTRAEMHKVIQISSPNPGDGKTTLSANLAISIAQSGKKVLLIDADFRRPRIHALFGLHKSDGISSVISGEVELPDAIQPTEVEHLWALPCGPRPNNPCELLTSRRFEELLAILRDQYDFVIVDTPPLLAVTDPGAVAPRVDGVIMTIRLTNRTRGEAMRATQLLAELGGNTLGVVVNGVGKTSKRGYGYGYGYGYDSYSAYGAYHNRYEVKYGYGNNDENPYYEDRDESVEKTIVTPRLRNHSRQRGT